LGKNLMGGGSLTLPGRGPKRKKPYFPRTKKKKEWLEKKAYLQSWVIRGGDGQIPSN